MKTRVRILLPTLALVATGACSSQEPPQSEAAPLTPVDAGVTVATVDPASGSQGISAEPRWFDADHNSSPYHAFIPEAYGDPASMAAAADLVAVVRVTDVVIGAESRSMSPDEEGFESETALVFDGVAAVVTEVLGKPTVDTAVGSEILILEPAALTRGDGTAELIPSENLEPLEGVLRKGEVVTGSYLAFLRFRDGTASLLPGGFVEILPDGSFGPGGVDGPFRSDEEFVPLPLTYEEARSWLNDGKVPSGWVPPASAIPGPDDVSPPGILTNDDTKDDE